MKKNKLNFKRGFTLIELLVVIAIIGILSSVVLASLNSARLKAKVAAVQSVMSSLRGQAELGVNQQGKYLANLCEKDNADAIGGLKTLLDSIDNRTTGPSDAGKNSKTKLDSLKCAQDTAKDTAPTKWAAQVEINSTVYCSDSTGFSGVVTPPGRIVGGYSQAGVLSKCKD